MKREREREIRENNTNTNLSKKPMLLYYLYHQNNTL